MAMILQKYKNKRKLGKGAYGDVLLVEDPDGKELAIKMINKDIIRKEPYLQEYIEDQKEVMLSVKDRYVMQLLDFAEDDNYKYFICQYCEGGDLLNYQAKQQNKVFTLKKATQILSQVIQGLEKLHKEGYLHRDIKPQNILLKKQSKQSKEDKYIFKLADFGFAKRHDHIGGTVLGTQNYMSPEIFSNQVYSFEVDMWAFGVLFYFMLNMEFPFKINPYSPIEQKRQDLLKIAKNFSYTEAIKKSKKKIIANCTQQVEDLFLKIFDLNGQKRITFLEIRLHPLFREYFPVIDHVSRIIYKQKKLNRFDTYVLSKSKITQLKPKPANKPQKKQQKTAEKQNNKLRESLPVQLDKNNAVPQIHFLKPKTIQQKAILDAQLDRINFLYQLSKDCTGKFDFIEPAQLMVLRYNLLKYYFILMRQFINGLKVDKLDEKYPDLKWKQFLKSSEFNILKTESRKKLDEAQIQLSQSYDQCLPLIGKMKTKNPSLEKNLQNQMTQTQFTGVFKKSYRDSTSSIYQKVRNKFSEGNYYPFLTALIIMCHAFNQLIACDNETLGDLFPEFVSESKKKEKPIQFSELRSWMSKANKQKIKNVIKSILDAFFS